jgi:hypothetical protein
LISGLADIKCKIEEPEPVPPGFGKVSAFSETEKVVEEVKRQLKDYWICLR